MKLGYGIVGAVVGGLVGAAIWTAIAYFTNFESGWIAWGVGALSGLGMAIGSSKEAGVKGGVLAAVIALLSITAGKYGVAYYMAHHYASTVSFTVEEARAFHEVEVEEEMGESGKKLTPPTGKQTVAPEATEEADRRWKKMSDAEKEQYATDAAAQSNALVAAAGGASSITSHLFMGSFGLFDLLFAGLAVFSAFRIGSQSDDA